MRLSFFAALSLFSYFDAITLATLKQSRPKERGTNPEEIRGRTYTYWAGDSSPYADHELFFLCMDNAAANDGETEQTAHPGESKLGSKPLAEGEQRQ
jgi:hypothetical protein